MSVVPAPALLVRLTRRTATACSREADGHQFVRCFRARDAMAGFMGGDGALKKKYRHSECNEEFSL